LTKFLLTGANGTLGGIFYKILLDSGITVIRVGRQPSDVQFDLNDLDPKIDFTEVSALIHCAWDFSCKDSAILTTNGFGSARLFDLARVNQIPILFISTLAAHSEVESRYGLTKYFLEKIVLEYEGCVARIGAFTSLQNGGLYARLQFLTKRMPISLLPGKKSHKYYETTEENLRRLIMVYLESRLLLKGSYFVASESPKALHEILNIKNSYIYLGIRIPFAFLRTLEFLTSRNLKSDNLKSLNRQAADDETRMLKRL